MFPPIPQVELSGVCDSPAAIAVLHHLPIGTTLEQIQQQLEQFLDSHQFLSAEQVQKTLSFIFSLVT
jgi:hypothetical protein